jgi:phosphate transport system substrate-binding protein
MAVSAAVAVTACGTDQNGPKTAGATPTTQASASDVECASGAVTGAGSTFVQTIAQQWIKDFGGSCPGATVNYQGVGSGAGIQQFSAGTVDFGATDAVMKPAEQQAAEANGGPVLHVPWASGGIAVLYRLDGVKELRLSPATLAGIFAGNVTRWDDPKLAADNPGTKLPGTPVQVVHRADGSGTTKVFTSYMTATAAAVWRAGADKDVPWPTGQGAKGSDGVAAAVKQADGAIGYAELSYAMAGGLGVAKIKNPAGQFVAPTGASVGAAVREATVPADLKVEANYAPKDPAAYPISTVTWALVHAKPTDPAKAKLLKAFLLYALGPGQQAAERLSYAPLPRELVVRAQAAVYGMAG